MNILIIGSEGSLGKSLRTYFSKNKEINKIYCIDKKVPNRSGKKVIFKEINLTKNIKNFVINEKIDLALFLSFNLNFNNIDKKKYFLEGKKILKNSLKIVKKNKIKKIIYFSSFAVYGTNKMLNYEYSKLNPVNIYGKLKAYCENEIKKSSKGNYKYLILRISQIYGDTIKSNIIYRFIKSASKNIPITLHGNGHQKRDFVNIRDFLDLINITLTFKKNNIYNVCGDKKYKIIDIIKLLKIKYIKIHKFTNLLKLEGSNKKIKKDFGWKQNVNFIKEINLIKKKLS